jgi:putative phosphoribosyl transferase
MARGGVPVAHELASLLAAPLDVLLVRKLGHPSQPELGLGALAEDAVRVLNEPLLARLSVPPEVIEDLTRRETGELLRRLSLYRSGRPPLDVRGRPVVVVDDGLATGFTARAALELVRRRGAAPVILAVPVGSPEAVASLRPIADEVLCLEVSDRFSGISQCYRDFTQVTDDEVTRLLGSPTA